MLGTVSGLLAALAVTSVASLTGLLCLVPVDRAGGAWALPWRKASSERHSSAGGRLGNDTVNLLNTLLAALAGGLLAAAFSGA